MSALKYGFSGFTNDFAVEILSVFISQVHLIRVLFFAIEKQMHLEKANFVSHEIQHLFTFDFIFNFSFGEKISEVERWEF
jgi:hypothetical protein